MVSYHSAVAIGGYTDKEIPCFLLRFQENLRFLLRFHQFRVKRVTRFCALQNSPCVPWRLLKCAVQAQSSAWYLWWRFLKHVFLSRTTSLWRTNKGKLAHCYSPIIIIPPKDPEEQVAAELGPQVRILQERYPGASVQATRKKEAQSGCRPRPHQLDDGKLADANKAEAACQLSPKCSACLYKTAFLKELPL